MGNFEQAYLENHVKKFIEGELRKYKTNQQIIQQYEEERQAIASKVSGGIGQIPESKEVSDPVFKRYIWLEKIEGKADRARRYNRMIDDVYNELLNDEERRIVKMKYFDGLLTEYGICRELGMDRTTFWRKKKEILRKFAERMAFM